MEAQTNEFLQIVQGAATPVSGVVVFLLWRLNKEVGELKTEIKTYMEVMSRFIPGGRD